MRSAIVPVPERMPGPVQSALLVAGLIKDWSKGLDSLHCERVENHHQEFFTGIAEGSIAPPAWLLP